jgi:putative tryptophan/tyrosine transport system substrate-binding protein
LADERVHAERSWRDDALSSRERSEPKRSQGEETLAGANLACVHDEVPGVGGKERTDPAARDAPGSATAFRISAASGQEARRVYRVGVLFPAGETPGLRDLADALAALGYVEGRNVVYEIRAAGAEAERLPALARELAAAKPDVIVSATERAGSALIEATRDIPIVLTLVGDPVALGLTQSIARPTRNVTGFTTANDSAAGKRLEILAEIVPALRKAGLLWVRENSQHRLVAERTREAAVVLGIELLSLPITDAEDIPPAIARAEQEQVGGLLVAADPITVRNRRTIIDQCLVRDLPAMHSYSFEVRDGALAAYGSDIGEEYGRTAAYVDRILRGARVAELPFQEPTQVALSLNLRTARSLRLTIPQSLLVRADEVFE